MVWLAKWIRENITDSRVLIITDRTELDEQIEKVFNGVEEEILRTRSGADLVTRLNQTKPSLICSLVHKFGRKEEEDRDADTDDFIEQMKRNIPADFSPKGKLFVFVDECHRTQSGKLHAAMTSILPDAQFIGFTGTPLMKKDKKKSVEVFGPYIHTYKFDEAVNDGVVLDLRYEARDIDQRVKSQKKSTSGLMLRHLNFLALANSNSSRNGLRCRSCCRAARGWNRLWLTSFSILNKNHGSPTAEVTPCWSVPASIRPANAMRCLVTQVLPVNVRL